jgi:hypothetical protein
VGQTLSLHIAFGARLKHTEDGGVPWRIQADGTLVPRPVATEDDPWPDDEAADLVVTDDDEALDAMQGLGDEPDWKVRSEAREALGIEFDHYSWGDELPRLLVITSSVTSDYDDTVKPLAADQLTPRPEWEAKLREVAAKLGCELEGEPGWLVYSRFW